MISTAYPSSHSMPYGRRSGVDRRRLDPAPARRDRVRKSAARGSLPPNIVGWRWRAAFCGVLEPEVPWLVSWLPWAWLAALPLAIGALFVGAQRDEADPERRFSFRSIRLIRVLPSLGLLVVAIAVAALAVFENPPDFDYSLWLVAATLTLLSIAASVWFSARPWW